MRRYPTLPYMVVRSDAKRTLSERVKTEEIRNVRQTRKYALVVLLGLGLLGCYFGVAAQEAPLPIPTPVRPPVESAPAPPSPAKTELLLSAPAPAKPTPTPFADLAPVSPKDLPKTPALPGSAGPDLTAVPPPLPKMPFSPSADAPPALPAVTNPSKPAAVVPPPITVPSVKPMEKSDEKIPAIPSQIDFPAIQPPKVEPAKPTPPPKSSLNVLPSPAGEKAFANEAPPPPLPVPSAAPKEKPGNLAPPAASLLDATLEPKAPTTTKTPPPSPTSEINLEPKKDSTNRPPGSALNMAPPQRPVPLQKDGILRDAAKTAESSDDKKKAFVLIKPWKKNEKVPVLDLNVKSDSAPSMLTGNSEPKNTPPSEATNSVTIPAGPVLTPAAGSALVNLQVPSILLEKRGPSSIRPGAPVEFQLVVRNAGNSLVTQIRVEDELPIDAKIVATNPPVLAQANKLVWLVPALPPGNEQTLNVTLEVAASSDFVSQTSVQVVASALTRIQTVKSVPPSPTPDPLVTTPAPSTDGFQVQVLGPGRVELGKEATFDIRVTNPGKQTVRGMVLHGQLPPTGVVHPLGTNIEADVGDLLPGSSKSFKMPVNTNGIGVHAIDVRISSKSGPEVTARGTVEVVPAAKNNADDKIKISTNGARAFVNREGEIRFEIQNGSGQVARNVLVVHTLGEGVDFIEASDRGMHQANARQVYWYFDQLAANESRALVIRVLGRKVGQFPLELMTKAERVPEHRASATLLVEGANDLDVRVLGEETIELGKKAIYTVQIKNTGNTAASNIRFDVAFPEGLKPLQVGSPVRYQVSPDQQTLRFDPFPSLGPNATLVFRVETVVRNVGDLRIRTNVTSDQITTPIFREKRVEAYKG